jgi:copper ion binding protein
MKRILLFAVAVMAVAGILQASTVADTLTWRIKSMRCEECAHKVGSALRKDKGVEAVSFDLEKRTVTIAYDAGKTCADSLINRLRGTRYKPTAYDPTEVINKGMGLQMAEMSDQSCADRIVDRMKRVEGIDSIAPHTDKHYVFFRYDANKTSKQVIRAILLDMGFTPVSYYTSKDISFAYFTIPSAKATAETVETALALDGVDDATVSVRNSSLAITYINTETSTDKLLQELKEEGIDATPKF